MSSDRRIVIYLFQRRLLCLLLLFGAAINTPLIVWKESDNLTKWYQPWEICMINSSNRNESMKETRSRCFAKVGKPKDRRESFRCRATGGVFGENICRERGDISLFENSYLRFALKGHDDPSQQPLLSLFNDLYSLNGSLLIVGDSIHEQLLAAMTCELEREKMKQYDWKVFVDNVMLPSWTRPVPIFHQKFGLWDEEALFGPKGFYSLIELSLEKSDTLVIIFNIGLWYHNYYFKDSFDINGTIIEKDRRHYVIHLNKAFYMLTGLKKRYPKKRFAFVWMETGAQHWSGGEGNIQNGYFPPDINLRHLTVNLSCVPIINQSYEADWRNLEADRVIHSFLRRFDGRNEIFRVIPWRAITLPMWSNHIRGSGVDCTHFCWSPMMYMPVYAVLAEAAKNLTSLLSNTENQLLNPRLRKRSRDNHRHSAIEASSSIASSVSARTRQMDTRESRGVGKRFKKSKVRQG